MWLTGFLLSGPKKDDGYFKQQTQKIQNSLIEKEEFANTLIPKIAADINKYPKDKAFEIFNTYEAEFSKHPDLHVYGYYNDSLIFWTSGSVLVPYLTFDEDFVQPVAKMKNGWYRFIKYQKDSLKMLGLIHIKNEFAINNQYLNKNFNPSFKVSESANIFIDHLEDSNNKVSDKNGKELFCIEYKKKDRNAIIYETWASVFYFLSVLFLLIFFYSLKGYDFFQKNKTLYVIVLITSIVGLRLVGLYCQWPRLLYKQPVFGPELFASSKWLPSLGDFILHAIGLTFIIFGVALSYQSRRIVAASRSLKKYIYLILITMVSALSGLGVTFLFEKLVLDSNISFDLSNLLVLDLYSFLGFSLITFLLLNYLVIAYALCRQLVRSRVIGFYEAIIFYTLAYGLFAFIIYSEGVLNVVPPIILYLLNLSVLSINYKRKHVFNFYIFAPIIFLFTIFSTYTLFTLNKTKEKAHRQNLAFKISDEQDYITEYLFTETVEELKNDQIVKQLLFDGEVRVDNEVRYPNELFDRIGKKYFGGYYTKYSLVVTPFSEDNFTLLGTEGADPLLEDYENSIEFNGKNTSCPDLFFIDNNYGKVNYIGKIEFSKEDDDGTVRKKYLYIEFISKIVTQVTGFPQLLLDDKITKPVDLSGYSYGIYKGNKLTVFGGDFVYPLNSQEIITPTSDVEYKLKDGYSHLIYRTQSGKIIIVSKRNSSVQEFFSPFAYMLIYFVAILFFYILYRSIVLRDKNSFQINFKTRIQVSILFILLVSLLVVGLGINNYVITQFNKKNKLNLQEKSNSILLEFKTRIEGMPDEEVNQDYIKYVLEKLSTIFFTDINFYHENGNLLASSRESIYNEGFLSRQMNPKAFQEMKINQQAFYMQSEKIGSFDYLSVYAVFRNNSNEVVGYINLPYFLRQKELKEDLASSLLSMINVFSLLIAISMIVTFIIASRLTEPLTVLQEKLGQIRIGRNNEIIDYKKNDEIGSLVQEYNRMIKELEKSAELLARSEREIAWREMAKQVAHEVKNPLTPMKLSVQYLLKAWDDGQPDFDQRLRRFRDAMIQQIETLSNIASEFSYFAKMPVGVRQETDIAELLTSCISFYEENEGDVKIEFKNLLSTPTALVILDKDQALRVFNNVIRNAIQSIPSDKIGEIYIELTETDSKYIASFQDNGVGIPDDIRDKIFSPNFTTKNSGMGLGLAMTKTILENMDGNIYFDTQLNEGTTFYIELKKINTI